MLGFTEQLDQQVGLDAEHLRCIQVLSARDVGVVGAGEIFTLTGGLGDGEAVIFFQHVAVPQGTLTPELHLSFIGLGLVRG